MTEKDFELVARKRIDRAEEERDAAILGRYLVENYTDSVRFAAIEALGRLCSDEGLKELLDALFRYTLGKETQVQIIKTLSGLLTEEDLEQVRVDYNVTSDKRTLRLYSVLDRCVNY